jgi:hypothetical protein
MEIVERTSTMTDNSHHGDKRAAQVSDIPEAVPISATDETEILRMAAGYYFGALRLIIRSKQEYGLSVLLRYHAAKALIPIRDRKKSDPQHNWMKYIEDAGMLYDTVNNSIKLAEAVDREIAAGTFKLKELEKSTWNTALRRFGVKQSTRSGSSANASRRSGTSNRATVHDPKQAKTPFDDLTAAAASLERFEAAVNRENVREATDEDERRKWWDVIETVKKTVDSIESTEWLRGCDES